MKCPNCGSIRLGVVQTDLTDSDDRIRIRRRRCLICDYRWYTFNPAEISVPDYAITPRPIPISERLPKPFELDDQGRCWWGYPEHDMLAPTWHLQHCTPAEVQELKFTNWLPHWAIPLLDKEFRQ